MRKASGTVRTAVFVAALLFTAMPGKASAADKGHEGMGGMGGAHEGMKHEGMKMEGHGGAAPGGHDMTKMGDKAFAGKVGPWNGEARLIDMKARMAGMKMSGPMPNSHHIALSLHDPKTKAAVTEGKGTVTVTGPDGKAVKTSLMVMQGHFGADVNLPKPGKYTFRTEVQSGGTSGSASFPYTVK